MTRYEVLIKAIETYGYDTQLNMAIEEMAELTKAICKLKRGGDLKQNNNSVKEEIADVQIMLDQLKIMLSAHTDVSAYDQYKINRLAERLGL